MESSQANFAQEPKNLAKGFFTGFVAAQFVSGWISGPLILVALFLYVFLGQAMRQAGGAIVRRMPAFLLHLLARVSASKADIGDPFSTQVEGGTAFQFADNRMHI